MPNTPKSKIEDPEQDAARERRAADLELVQRVLAGDEVARRLFADKMTVVARALAHANTRMGKPLRPHDLADLAQDTLVKILGKLESFEGRATLETWAHRFCYLEFMNRIRARMRAKGKSVSLETVEVSAQEASPKEFELVERALEELGSPDADVIRLKHYEGMSFPEIGKELDIPSSTAKTRYYRGLAFLRRHLSKHEREDRR